MGIKVNLGSGPTALPGWENLDRSPGLLVRRVPGLRQLLATTRLLPEEHLVTWAPEIKLHDLRRRLRYADQSVDAIYCCHTLEHMYLDDVPFVLGECRRVIKEGATVRIVLPDGGAFAAALVAAEFGHEATLEYNRRLGSHPVRRPSGVRRLLTPFSASPHRWQPTGALAARLLRDAGFNHVEEFGFRSGRLPDLQTVEHREESVFVEASWTR